MVPPVWELFALLYMKKNQENKRSKSQQTFVSSVQLLKVTPCLQGQPTDEEPRASASLLTDWDSWGWPFGATEAAKPYKGSYWHENFSHLTRARTGWILQTRNMSCLSDRRRIYALLRSLQLLGADVDGKKNVWPPVFTRLLMYYLW